MNKTLMWLLGARSKKANDRSTQELLNQNQLFEIVEKVILTEEDLVTFKSLIEAHKVDPDTRFEDLGKTALMIAANNGHLECIRLLIANGADVNLKDKTGYTALILATKQNEEAAVNLLIASGADVNVVDRYGNSPLIYAINKRNVEAVNLIMSKNAKVNIKSKKGTTPIMHAAVLGIVEFIDILANNKALVDTRSPDGSTALMMAALKGQHQALQRLIHYGSMIEAKDRSKYTALMLAALNGQEECVKILIDCNANINSKNKHGQTAFVLAASLNHVNCLKLLHQTGKITPEQLGRALQTAAMSGHYESIHALLEMGADKQYTDGYNRNTATQLAERYGYHACVDLINGGIYVNPGINAVTETVISLEDYITKNAEHQPAIIKCLEVWRNNLDMIDQEFSCEDPFSFATLTEQDAIELHLGKTIEGSYQVAAYQDETLTQLIKSYVQTKINLGPNGSRLVAVTKGTLQDIIAEVDKLIAKYTKKPDDAVAITVRHSM